MKKFILFTFLMIGAMSFSFAQTQYYLEDLEAGVPADWTITGDWAYGNAAQTQSAYFALDGNATNFLVFNDDGLGAAHGGSGRVTTGVIDLTGVSAPLFMELEVQFLNGDYQGADETAQVMISTDGGATWNLLVDFGAVGAWDTQIFVMDDYAGQEIMLSFDYNDGANGGSAWNFGFGFDNLSFSDIPIYIPRRDYKLSINGGSQFTEALAGVEYPLQGVFFNDGWEAVTSFDINVTANGVTNTYNFDGMNIQRGDAYRYEVEEKMTIPDGFTTYMVDVSNVNGDDTPDENVVDNARNLIFNTSSTGNVHPDKAVLVEEGTGTWCQWCPRGTVYLDEMSKRFGEHFVGIAVHNGDPMVVSEYDSSAGFSSFPGVDYNRRTIMDPSDIVSPSISDMQVAPPAAITVGAQEDGAILKTSMEVTFAQDVNENYRIAIILTEDGIVGDGGNAWNQINAYSGGGNGAMGGFEFMGTAVSPEIWPYDHVGRSLIGGYAGLGNIISGAYAAGDVASYFFPDAIIPNTWNKDKMHIVALLISASGQIANVKSSSYADAIARGLSTSTEEELEYSFLSVYPNPVADRAIVRLALEEAKDVNVTLVNSLGKRVSTQSYGRISGNQELVYNMDGVNTGVYFLNIQIDDQVVTQRITKS